jgi:hypothetical protein
MTARARKPETGRSALRVRGETLERVRAEIGKASAGAARGDRRFPPEFAVKLTVDAWLNWILDRLASHRSRSSRASAKRRAGRNAACQAPDAS